MGEDLTLEVARQGLTRDAMNRQGFSCSLTQDFSKHVINN